MIDPPPADLAKGSAAWSFTGQSELIGNGKIDLVWEKKIDHLEVGKSVEINIPRLIPRARTGRGGRSSWRRRKRSTSSRRASRRASGRSTPSAT